MRLHRAFLTPAFVLALLVPKLAPAGDTCPVTVPPSPPFVPPAPYQPNAAQGGFWYGTNDLWTQLPVQGVWRGLPRDEKGGYSNKLFLWQQGYDGKKEPQPDIVVVIRRLDSSAPPVASRGGTNAFFSDTWEMLTGVMFPTDGCWEITSHHDGHILTFVLSIPP
jgi:hypothetical protein